MKKKPILTVRHLSKSFGDNAVLRDIDFSVCAGDVISVIGASGSGKSTLLRCINLLETPTAGEILHGDVDILKEKINVPDYRSRVGMVFQNFNLFNNLTALDNCTVGLVKIRKLSKKEAHDRAMLYLDKVGMAPFINAKPRQLSGGQKQRVAIARALATKPEMLLCDEPTSALDSFTTKSMLALLKEINKTLGVTIVIITHEMSVVKSICNRVAVIDASHFVESGRTKEVFSHPQSDITKLLLGDEEVTI
ncbi:MAG: amino acid ABC transporter ATP-binding protein [Ruthenibacterium sp.]